MALRILASIGWSALLASSTTAQPRVDAHQHLFSPAISKLAPQVRHVDSARLAVLLDEAGIRRGIILSTAYQFGNPNRSPVENEYEHVKAENDWTSAQVARLPDRFRGFCGVNPLKS
jgi:predicted TIM-barrel fold metal-dependent hydrolase